MSKFFGSLAASARTIMLIGLLTRLVTLVLGLFINLGTPIVFVRITADVLLFVGALLYFFGEEANGDVKNVYGASLFVIIGSVADFILVSAMAEQIPYYVFLFIELALIAFELFAVCDICLFATNYLEDTLTKVLTIIVFVLTVVAIFVYLMFVFWNMNNMPVGAVSVLNMIVAISMIGCFALAFANLLILILKD
ncbi:MAG: hypothetical protein E7178_03635 [Erysipelotrichaceae bacterium]|nr:hypothetical protein [Erysipelotrichaceae bacterium]